MVAMETMHYFIVQLSLSLRTKILCISGVPMNYLAPMKNCPGGCKVGQISSRGIRFRVSLTNQLNRDIADHGKATINNAATVISK